METFNPDAQNIKHTIKQMFTYIGENPERQGLIDTPERIVNMWKEIYRGYGEPPKITLFNNGEDGVKYYETKSKVLFDDGDISNLSYNLILDIFSSAPCDIVYKEEYLGKPLCELMADIGFMASRGEGRRAIKGGYIKINNIPIITDDMNILLDNSHIINNHIMVLRHGRKQYFVVMFE